MARRLALVFLIVFMLGFFDYVGTQLSHAFTLSGSSVSSQSAGVDFGHGSSDSLSSIDFNLFSTSGVGWSFITQGYGHTPYSAWYIDGWHNGVDIAARYGAPIYSPRDGVVIATGDQDNFCPGRGFGRFVAVSDPEDGIVLWYAHLGQIDVAAGQTISKGAEIGTIGATGRETGTHLHFSVFEATGFSMKNKNGCGPDADGRDSDPIPYLQKFSN